MKMSLKQTSSLEKIRTNDDLCKAKFLKKYSVVAGEEFSYQIAIATDAKAAFDVKVESPVAEYVKLYCVKNIVMDLPCYSTCKDEDFITKEKGYMPDLLFPIERQNNMIKTTDDIINIWVETNIPDNFPEGEYEIKIIFSAKTWECNVEYESIMTLKVLNVNLPSQRIIYTQWLHVDCIADAHNVKIYSEEHWKLIDEYIKLASRLGINMILTPVITPPLDTNVGHARPCTQLVKIFKNGDLYSFDYSLLKRWIDLCKKNGINKFEISHLFSQWGIKYTPNIYAEENGEQTHIFGWHVLATDNSYRVFLEQFLPSLKEFLTHEGILDNCYFHLSDEPSEAHVEAYRYAYELVTPLLQGCKMMDALSDVEFYEHSLVQIPVPAINCLPKFIEKNVEHRWGYYCNAQFDKVTNRYFAMPSNRNRIAGLQMYKYDLEGFLHWGYNFYYTEKSTYSINPYVTSSADMSFPSGDSYSVYPGDNEVYPSLRAIVFKEALQDVEICRLLEGYIGREKVIEMIDNFAGGKLTIFDYPKETDFILNLMSEMKRLIEDNINKSKI